MVSVMNASRRKRLRYQVWIDGREAGSVKSVGDAWAFVLQAASVAPIGSVLRYQVREGATVLGDGEVDVSPIDARHSALGASVD